MGALEHLLAYRYAYAKAALRQDVALLPSSTPVKTWYMLRMPHAMLYITLTNSYKARAASLRDA